MLTDGLKVSRSRAYLDSLSMDGAEVAVNWLCSVRSCPTCWCPDSELADAHRGECKYHKMAEVMEELDAERDVLLDAHDELVGLVKDVRRWKSVSDTSCYSATLGASFLSLSSSCALPRTSCISGNQVYTNLLMSMCSIYNKYSFLFMCVHCIYMSVPCMYMYRHDTYVYVMV